MTSTPRRPAATVALIGLAALLLTACGTGPVRSGAAATVGDKRISTEDLAAAVRRGLKDPQAQQQLGADKAKYQRDTLGRMIRHEVLAEAARRDGVSASPGAVDAKLADFERQAGGKAQLLQTAAQGGIAEPDLRGFVSDIVLTDQIGDQLTANAVVPASAIEALYRQNAAQYDQVHSAHILVRTKAQADSILAQVKANPSQFAALAAKFSTDTSNKDKGGDLGFAGKGQFVKQFETAVFGAKPGSYLVVRTQFGYHVVHVIERRTTTLAQATPALRRGALQKLRDEQLGQQLAKVAKDLHVQVNPRFGRWDLAQLAVVAGSANDAVSSPAPAPGGAGGVGDPGTGTPGGGAPPAGGATTPPP